MPMFDSLNNWWLPIEDHLRLRSEFFTMEIILRIWNHDICVWKEYSDFHKSSLTWNNMIPYQSQVNMSINKVYAKFEILSEYIQKIPHEYVEMKLKNNLEDLVTDEIDGRHFTVSEHNFV